MSKSLQLVAVIGLALPARPPAGPPAGPPAYPFAVGETLRYTATLGYLPIGEALLTVDRITRERGAETFVLTMSGEGGPPGFGVSYNLTSWVGTREFTSRRFHRRINQAGRVTDQRFVIYPESSRYSEEGKPQSWLAPPEPLDELAFLYFLRSVPLRVGESYAWSRYFHTGYNPIKAQVLRRELVRLPDGQQAPCLAVRVATRAGGSEIWLTDDARRLPVMLRGRLAFGEVTLRLRAMSGSSAQYRPR